MSLYTRAGANPLSGCVPALIQLPVFYALFTFFPVAFVLRLKSFLWADDLSSYDSIYDLPFNIPFYGDHISLFPILASIAIFFYTKMTTGQQPMPQHHHHVCLRSVFDPYLKIQLKPWRDQYFSSIEENKQLR